MSDREFFFPFMLCANGLSCRLCGSLVSEIISNHSTALNDWRTSKAESVTPNQSSIVNTLYPFIKKRNSRTIIILSSKDECHVPSAADTGFFLHWNSESVNHNVEIDNTG